MLNFVDSHVPTFAGYKARYCAARRRNRFQIRHNHNRENERE
jgi:hypothetical protein